MRKPDKKLWATPKFKDLLSKSGHITPAGLKIIVENQRNINTELYESIEKAILAAIADRPDNSKQGGKLSEALKQVRKVPGSGPPECRAGGGGAS